MDELTRINLERDESLRKIHNKIDKIEDWEKLPSQPMVSICIATYNHENFIGSAIEGVLMQLVDFPYEIIIKEDKSTDSTKAILLDYQEKYPDKIRLWLCKENLYRQKLKPKVGSFTRGKYIASCDGDDYWTDPYKLQKQVEFMENHPDYSLVAGGYIAENFSTGQLNKVVKNITEYSEVPSNGFDITLDRQLENWLTKALTVLYRKDFSTEYFSTKYRFSKDVHLYYHLLKRGRGYYLPEVLGRYRLHEGGVFSLKSEDSKLITAYQLAKELYEIHCDRYSRKLYAQSIRNILKGELYKRNIDFKRSLLVFNLFCLIRELGDLKSFIHYVLRMN